MKNIYIILVLAAAIFSGCSKDDVLAPQQPEATGTFIDTRDNKTYHYVTYGGLDWSVENLAYDLNDEELCIKFQPSELVESNQYDNVLINQIGLHYTYSGALKAVPEGWHVPTDEEWSKLETTYAFLLPDFNLLYAGYRNKNVSSTMYNDRFLGSWAFFWSSSKDPSKDGEYYFYRKIFYNHKEMTRYSMEPEACYLSVRIVREHQ